MTEKEIGRRAPFAYSGELDPRRLPHTPSPGAREPYNVGTFKCKDGFVSFLPLGPRMWPDFLAMIEKPDLADDPKFNDSPSRSENHAELSAIFQQWLDKHTRNEVFQAGQKAGLPCSPVYYTNEVLKNEHFKSRKFFIDVEDPILGKLQFPGSPFGLANADSRESRPAPRPGQDNQTVLADVLGMSAEEIASLRTQKVI